MRRERGRGVPGERVQRGLGRGVCAHSPAVIEASGSDWHERPRGLNVAACARSVGCFSSRGCSQSIMAARGFVVAAIEEMLTMRSIAATKVSFMCLQVSALMFSCFCMGFLNASPNAVSKASPCNPKATSKPSCAQTISYINTYIERQILEMCSESRDLGKCIYK